MKNGQSTLVSFVEHIVGQPLTPWQERILIGAHGRMTGKESILKSLTGVDISGYRKALWYVTDEFRDKVIFAQAGSQIASVFPEPSAWREFIETNRPIDDGVSWLFRKSLVSMAITQVIKS